MKTVRIGLLVIFSLGAVYLALAGWVGVEVDAALREKKSSAADKIPVKVNGIEWESEDDFWKNEIVRRARLIFPWGSDLPKPVNLFLTAVSFGYLGGMMRVLYDLSFRNSEIDNKTLYRLGLSSFSGLLILGLSYTLPSALTASDVSLKPITLLFLCLFAGLFSEQLLLWLQGQFEKMFPR